MSLLLCPASGNAVGSGKIMAPEEIAPIAGAAHGISLVTATVTPTNLDGLAVRARCLEYSPSELESMGAQMGGTGAIRVGIGGWTYEPWRGTFYPDKLTQKRELEYASRQLTSIEINGTFYGAQKPETFAKWRDETPDGFVFSLKAPRFATNRGVLGDAGGTIARFFASGVMELKGKLGPINWQLMPTKKFDPADFEAFLRLLPKEVEGRALRHVVEVRHESFRSPEF